MPNSVEEDDLALFGFFRGCGVVIAGIFIGAGIYEILHGMNCNEYISDGIGTLAGMAAILGIFYYIRRS